MKEAGRNHIWDYLRSFVFFLLFLDHVFHAYALHFNRWHFFADRGADWVDYVYLHNNTIIVPLLFFIIGLFVIPSFQAQGASSFWKGRLMKLGVPWLIGIPFVVPFLCYPQYLHAYPTLGLYDFLTRVYFPDLMQGGGPFWILWYLLVLTGIALALYCYTPVIGWAQQWVKAWANHRLRGTLIFALIVIVLLIGSDLYYGPYHWVGMVNFLEAPSLSHEVSWIYHVLNLFKVQGSRFLVQGLFFFLGVAVGASPLLKERTLWQAWGDWWKQWLGLYLLSFVAYGIYVGAYLDDSFGLLFSNRFSLLWHDEYEGPRILEAFYNHLAIACPRLILQGITLVITAMAWISVFHHFMKRLRPWFCTYARHSYGIFLLHELPVIWMQYFLSFYDLPLLIKISLNMVIAGMGTFFMVKGLKKIPGASKIL